MGFDKLHSCLRVPTPPFRICLCPGEAEGGYLKPELTLASSSAASQAARPAGVALDGGGRGAEESKTGGGGARGGGGNRLGGGRGSGSGTGSGSGAGKRTGKPGWLKIN